MRFIKPRLTPKLTYVYFFLRQFLCIYRQLRFVSLLMNGVMKSFFTECLCLHVVCSDRCDGSDVRSQES